MLKNIMRVVISNAVVVIIGLINGFVFPKFMEIDEYAIFQTYTMYLTYVGILSLGIPTAMYLKYGGKSFQSINKAQYKSEVILLIIVLLAFTVLVVALSLVFKNWVGLLLGLSIFPYCITIGYCAVYQSWGRFKEYSRINVLIPAAICVGSLGILFIAHDLSGYTRIQVYILIYCATTVYFLRKFIIDTNQIKMNPISGKDNKSLFSLGLPVSLGSFASGLLSTVDRQFVSLFYSMHSFAMYAFGVSMQNLVLVFMQAISQPIYTRLAARMPSQEVCNHFKQILLVLGSFASVLYFPCALVVQLFLPEYQPSLNVIAIYFTVFPAYAVVSCLYLNLYKIKRKTRRYSTCIFTMLFLTIIIDSLLVYLSVESSKIALSNVFVYYFALLFFGRDFPEFGIALKDIGFCLLFLLIFAISVSLQSLLTGFILLILSLMVLSLLFYKEAYNFSKKRLLNHKSGSDTQNES